MAEHDDDGVVGTIIVTPMASPEDRNKSIDLLERVIEAEINRTLLAKEEKERLSPAPQPSSAKSIAVAADMEAMWATEKTVFPNNMFHVGLDLEGVDLGRAPGTLELISLSVWSTHRRYTFVIDATRFFFDSNPWQDKGIERDGRRLLKILENLLNHERCITVLHDCRRDCDALWHHLKLKPRFVHDTSAANWVLTGQEHVSLNDNLRRWGMPINSSRGRIDYISEPKYWAKRPLTREMAHYAAGDVHHLVPMALLQQEAAIPMLRLDQVREQSEYYRDSLQGMERTWVECKVPMGKFFGKGGSTIRLTEKRTGCFFYQSGSAEERNAGFQVYYSDEDGLRAATRALGWR